MGPILLPLLGSQLSVSLGCSIYQSLFQYLWHILEDKTPILSGSPRASILAENL